MYCVAAAAANTNTLPPPQLNQLSSLTTAQLVEGERNVAAHLLLLCALHSPDSMFAPPLIATDVAAADSLLSTQLEGISFPTVSSTSLPPASPALHSSHTSYSSDVPASPSLSSSDPRLSRRGPNLSATRRPIRRVDVPPSPLPFTSPHMSAASSLNTPLIPALSSSSFAAPSHSSTLTAAFSSIAHTAATGTTATSSILPPLPPFSLSSAATSTTQLPPLPGATTQPTSTAGTPDSDDLPLLGLLLTSRKRRKKAQPTPQPAKRTRKAQQPQNTNQQQPDEEETKEAEREEEERKEIPLAQRTLADFIRDNRSGEVSASVKQRMEKQKQDREAARKKRQEEKESEKKRAEEEKAREEGGNSAADGHTSEQKEQRNKAAAATEESKEELAADERKDGDDHAVDEGDAGEEAEVDGEAAPDEDEEEKDDEDGSSSAPVDSHLSIAPQMKIVNGQIVINEESLVVASPDTLTSDLPLLAAAPANRFTSATFSKAAHSLPWTHEETALFYRLLSSFGTDFTLLSSALKGRSRGEVKRKYKKEERERAAVVDEALKKRVKMSMSEFSKWRSDKAAAEESAKGSEVKAGGEAEGVAATGGGGGTDDNASGKKRERVMLNNRAGKRKKKGQQQQAGADEDRKEDSGEDAAQAADDEQSVIQQRNVGADLYNDGEDGQDGNMYESTGDTG